MTWAILHATLRPVLESPSVGTKPVFFKIPLHLSELNAWPPRMYFCVIMSLRQYVPMACSPNEMSDYDPSLFPTVS